LLRISNALQRANHEVLKIEIEPWIARSWRIDARAKRSRRREAAARFCSLSKDSDDATLIEQALNDILAEALQSRTSDIHLSLQKTMRVAGSGIASMAIWSTSISSPIASWRRS